MSFKTLSAIGVLIAAGIVAGCRADVTPTPGPTASTDTAEAPPPQGGITLVPIEDAHLASAQAAALAAAPDGTAYLLYGTGDAVYVVPLAEDSAPGAETQLNGDIPAILSPIEPPAIVVDGRGAIHVAWMSLDDAMQSSFWIARSEDRGASFSAPTLIAQTEEPGTMIHLAVDPSGSPAAAWLQGLSLVLARSEDGGQTFSTTVLDEEVCDCCRPQLSIREGSILVAYRNSEYDDQGRNIRDVHVGRVEAGGEFSAARAADGHWYLNACPISGPALAAHEGELLVAWMDGRHDSSGHLERTDIWFGSSSDAGATFGPNTRVSTDATGYRSQPTLAVDAGGGVHIVWSEESAQGAVLVYAASTNGGHAFGAPQVIVRGEDGAKPSNPMLVSARGILYLVWMDRNGAHLARLAEAQP